MADVHTLADEGLDTYSGCEQQDQSKDIGHAKMCYWAGKVQFSVFQSMSTIVLNFCMKNYHAPAQGWLTLHLSIRLSGDFGGFTGMALVEPVLTGISRNQQWQSLPVAG